MDNVMRTEGSKYNDSLNVVEIAKLIRKDLTAAVKAGQLPKGIKFGVTVQKFSMGCSLTIAVKTFPGQVLNPARVLAGELGGVHGEYSGNAPRNFHCEQWARVERTLEGIANAYNRTASDSQTDYHNTNFYLHVLCQVDTAAERANVIATYLGDLKISQATGLDVAPLPWHEDRLRRDQARPERHLHRQGI
jgi:hypothetical protein